MSTSHQLYTLYGYAVYCIWIIQTREQCSEHQPSAFLLYAVRISCVCTDKWGVQWTGNKTGQQWMPDLSVVSPPVTQCTHWWTLGQMLLPWWLAGDTAPVCAGDINSQVPSVETAGCLLLRAGAAAAAWRHHDLVFSWGLDAVTSENITIFTSVRDQKKCYNAATMVFFLERIL